MPEAPFMLRRLLVSALIIAGGFTLARADVYRWVDDKGQPHYSDQWMPGSEVVKTSKAHPPGTDGTMRTADQKSLAASNKNISSQVDAQDNSRAVQKDVASRHAVLC